MRYVSCRRSTYGLAIALAALLLTADVTAQEAAEARALHTVGGLLQKAMEAVQGK